ncbi:hypothetical protein [Streptomyces sp. TS71-3]|uniref:hypothetical protein n=1 Tax=Streptomyces sp. TS71-3 TaxID=2733862 RepID=UPI001B1AC034|nr:hypothetical protein [Streptomyces sp. TS71-3]GHJ39429.1 hypothetical protein Sm713_50380 [Streptomyces sp. TS71-3]
MTYLGSGDPVRERTDYYPPWLDQLADDVTLEGAALNGVVHGADNVRKLLAYARTLYEYQDFEFIGKYGENGFVEDYSSRVQGQPIANIAVVRKNAAGQAQSLIMNHRPLASVLMFSRLMGKHFAGTQYARYFMSDSAGGRQDVGPSPRPIPQWDAP